MRKFLRLWHDRLFSSQANTATTLALVALLAAIIPNILRWAVIDATFAGSSREACADHAGACWVFVKVRFWQFMYGLYPEAEYGRIHGLEVLLVCIAGIGFLPMGARHRRAFIATAILLYPLVAFLVLLGGFWHLQHVDTSLWGGFMLTLIISATGIAGSLPLGIILALGRRSPMPLIRTASVAFIELWRGVPLITVLFMASVMLPLFLPRDMHVDKLVRALVGTTLFASAYMAEVIRGGLQAIGSGQTEAAQALGLGYVQTMRLVVLPQALRLVIPGIVNTFIGLVKDTSLVLIIGMFDLLGIVQAAATDPHWLGMAMEGYVFAGCCYWIICYSLSVYSQRLELQLHQGARH